MIFDDFYVIRCIDLLPGDTKCSEISLSLGYTFSDFDSCSGCPSLCDTTEPTHMCVDNMDKTYTCLYGLASLTWNGPDPVLYLDSDGNDNLNALQGSVLYTNGQVTVTHY